MSPAARYVIRLRSVRETDAATVGSKASNLARMLNAGLPVPDGFCVLAEAYRQHVAGAGLPEPSAGTLERIRNLIVSFPMADETAAAIRAAFAALGSARVAVRSSSTAEDLPGHSFAGLYDTFLETTDAGGCVELVKRCWASLWTERAFEYRERNGIEHVGAAMAVVVQRLIAAEAAGVVFTADPVSGRRDRIVVEAAKGLGDRLVSGRATPDRFVLSRRNLRPVERSTAEAVLDDRLARSVCRLALEAERLFGKPQDMEWALAEGDVRLLQSRPITTLKERSWEDRQVWSTTNVAEVLPGVLTPMVWSTAGDYVGRLLGGILARIGISLGDHPFIGEVAGRVYTNLNTFTGMVRRMPFANRMSQAQMFGGQGLKPEDRAKLEMGEDDLPDIRLSPLKTLVRLPGFLVWIVRHGPNRGRKWITSALDAYARKPRPDLTRFSEQELASRAVATMEQMGAGGEGLGYALCGMMYTTVHYDLCRKWLKDETGAMAGRLLAGTGDLQSANAGLELWRLARSAAASAELRAVLLSPVSWDEVRTRLGISEPGRSFLARWDRFMHLHGHHARGEMDMAKQRWREQPDYVLAAVRGYMAAADHDPEADISRRAREAERVLAKLTSRLRCPVKRLVFGYVVRRARLSAAIRENMKDAAIRIIADTRAALVELGQRLAARGVLDRGDDIFFLRFHELEPAVSGVAGLDVRRTVAERRAEYERNLLLSPPAIVVGRYDPSKHPPDKLDQVSGELAGLAVSPGVATGPARVILYASAGEQVQPGEILVAPFTDPGWTPYFIPAAGIVMDQGGLLSHGSIVAREYGIPAVVNVGPATKIIKTGQMIQVDGNLGRVRILKEADRG